jgi:hypothetical protein
LEAFGPHQPLDSLAVGVESHRATQSVLDVGAVHPCLGGGVPQPRRDIAGSCDERTWSMRLERGDEIEEVIHSSPRQVDDRDAGGMIRQRGEDPWHGLSPGGDVMNMPKATAPRAK